ncbi:MAG: carboxypeptidase regulatory-like domain-containing protein [Gemmatimonadetes bacterium]|nr:MAG: carboxypeptidase regulatory-like domain-containing protein [Gemmatimonadota bacterium]
MRIPVVLLLGLVLCGITTVFAAESSTIHGFVLDENGNPLESVRISVTGTQQYAITGQDGTYTIEIESGSYLVQASTLDMVYEPAIKWVDLAPDEETTLNFILFKEDSKIVDCNQINLEQLLALWRQCYDNTRFNDVMAQAQIDGCQHFVQTLVDVLVDNWEYQSRDYARQIDQIPMTHRTTSDYASQIQKRRYYYNQFKNAHWILSWLIEPPPYPVSSFPKTLCQDTPVNEKLAGYLSDPDPRIKAIVIDILGSATDIALLPGLKESLKNPEWLSIYESMYQDFRLSPMNFDIWDAMYNFHEFMNVDFSTTLKTLAETHPSQYVRRRSMAQLTESYPDIAKQVREIQH